MVSLGKIVYYINNKQYNEQFFPLRSLFSGTVIKLNDDLSVKSAFYGVNPYYSLYNKVDKKYVFYK